MTGINVDRDGPEQAESSASAAAAVFKRLHPEQYLSRFLSKGYRPDGRKLGESRQASINTGEQSVNSEDFGSHLRLHIDCKWVRSCQNRRHHCRMWHQSRDRRARSLPPRRGLHWWVCSKRHQGRSDVQFRISTFLLFVLPDSSLDRRQTRLRYCRIGFMNFWYRQSSVHLQ